MAYAHSQLDGRSPPDPMHEVRFKVKSVPSSPIHHNFTISGSHVRRRPIFNYLEYLDYDLLHIHETVLRGCARDRGDLEGIGSSSSCTAGSCFNSSCDSPHQSQPYQALVRRYTSFSIHRPLSILAVDFMTLPYYWTNGTCCCRWTGYTDINRIGFLRFFTELRNWRRPILWHP